MYQLQTLMSQSSVLRQELLRELRNNKFEVSEGGLLMFSRTGLQVGGIMGHDVLRRSNAGPIARSRRGVTRRYMSLGRQEDHNLVPGEGINRLVENWLAAGAQIPNVYVSIFEGDYTPVGTVTAASYPADATESTAYTEGTRQAFTPGSVASGSVDNTASRAEFTMNAAKTIFGGGLHPTSTKSATTAPLMAAVRFSTSRSVVNTDILQVDYTFTAADT